MEPTAPQVARRLSPGSPAREVLKSARRFARTTTEALATAERRRTEARAAFEIARDDVIRHQLNELPLSRLRETTKGGLRLGAIERAGFKTVGAAAAAGERRLVQIEGVGWQTATQVVAAARQLVRAMEEGVRFRFDPDNRPDAHAALLVSLRGHEMADEAVSPVRDEAIALSNSVEGLTRRAGRTSSRVRMFFSAGRRREEALQALEQLAALMATQERESLEQRLGEANTALDVGLPSKESVWSDYEARTATYNGLLIDVGDLAPDHDAEQGFIPTDVAERVNKQPLDIELLRLSLRGYQAFGAKFALAQRKAILGDEMGLGKTIEALAAMCHLYTRGAERFLVICPASVLVNWCHEIERHTDLKAHRVHGADFDRNETLWGRQGGVGVTTFDSARYLELPDDVKLPLLVVDEAHYVKNPRAIRTQVARYWIERAERTLFLTGTPMENRVEEFRVLVDHLQPTIASRISGFDGLAGATSFRRAVAPVYLRRNQEDVLQELPDRIESEDWVELESEDFAAYRDAVASGNFMAMRQAAYMPRSPSNSAKLARLVEIVEEAVSGGRKIVVFSYFLQVLETVASALNGFAMGPLTGRVAPTARQQLVDDFAALETPAVLVSQIQAGGVGLNIQAASVVILTEPQWKPSTEDQAIARCHRMGQSRTVNVHRLLAEDSVDQRMLEIIAQKAALFDEYVRKSALKDSSPDAIDISDLEATDDAVSQAEAERRIVELERRRLGLEPDDE